MLFRPPALSYVARGLSRSTRKFSAGVFLFVGFILSSMVQSQGATPQRVQLILVGDSTMATKNGYGDALCAAFDPASVQCQNLAKNGRSSGSFRAEGLWDNALSSMKEAKSRAAPSYVLIQFGHNDQPGKPGRSTDLATEFPVNVARYVKEAREAGATPILLTPLTRRSFKNGAHQNDLIPWADATRKVSFDSKADLIELNALSARAVVAMGSEEADTLAEEPKPKTPPAEGAPKSKFDYTHLGPKGAKVFSAIVLKELLTLKPELRELLAKP